ncbi:MAG: DUF1553 domain-containing protein, partial [Gemmataceae bacterium]|nr:DUF1553 domain-containing protein [Gemmataceae bacterium]
MTALLLLIASADAPSFSRHVEAALGRLGCNGGTCHGAVKGQGGFSLSLFGADPLADHAALVRGGAGRRIDHYSPADSLLLKKAAGRVPHGGGVVLSPSGADADLLKRWIAAGAPMDDPAKSRVVSLKVTPARQTGEKPYDLRVEAAFADGSAEDVTRFCSFEARDAGVASVSPSGRVVPGLPGETAIVVRYRAEPALHQLAVPRQGKPSGAIPNNALDARLLAKLDRLGLSPAPLADEATFLRRASLDAAGELPRPDEVRAFLADTRRDKRERKIEELLARPGHAALWTLKFCDLLKASDFGVYADGIRQDVDAPRFQAWVRARMDENTPYDEFVERILTATSREGRPVQEWVDETVAMEEGYAPGRPDLEAYKKRKTLDLYWQRQSSTGVDAALQVAHAFLGLRLECARCHRHPHDVWKQDDLLSFANFFMPVRKIGFGGDNEKKYPEVGAHFKRLNAEVKELEAKAKKDRAAFKGLEAEGRKAKAETQRLTRELQRKDDPALRKELEKQQALAARADAEQARLARMERRSKLLYPAAQRIMHSEIRLVKPDKPASVTSPLGTQSSKALRLLGETTEATVGEDPRRTVMEWMRRPDNKWFARAIVNRVWAHYFGKGIIDPPDDLSAFNPPSHPELLDDLCRGFVASGYDLRWLHRAVLRSRSYQQEAGDGAHYAGFARRRLPAEVLLDALDSATGTREKLGMEYHHWPETMRATEIPYTPRNGYVAFMLEQFGKPKRNAAVQCDCERDGSTTSLHALSLMNHPRLRAKIADPAGRAARLAAGAGGDARRIEELFLATVSRLPTEAERAACLEHVKESKDAATGYRGVLWSL